ncbi:MAG: hypothetical protein LBP32_06875 [Spirochaetaceae bacterium]|jgi:hypothetical protein|nr:hypothetical protein [Spirochaetaceae bacterium]
MGGKKSTRLADLWSDRFSDVWKLLSETTMFLSRTKEFTQHEAQLRSWRLALQSARGNPDISRKVRSELTELRKSLRLEGYDLSLVRHNLVFDGFRNETSFNQGFRRVVLFIGDDDIYWLSGDNNHIALAEFLEKNLEKTGDHRILIRSRHYLWYRRRRHELILSGSDTEMKDDYTYLKAMGEANPLLFLSKLKGLW